MCWARRYVGTPDKIADQIWNDVEGIPPAVRLACKTALGALSREHQVIFETSGHVDAASADFLIEVKNVDAMV